MDACNGSWADVVDQMAEDDPIHEGSPQVFMQADLESHLDALSELFHQFLLFSHLFHFSPNRKLWIYRFQISLWS